MLGFLPGFAYMGSVDRRIAMPRLDTPRMRVAAGSVGIAGDADGHLPMRYAGRVAHHRPDVGEAVRSDASASRFC